MEKKNLPAIIAGNWKMNMTRLQTQELIEGIRPLVGEVQNKDCQIVVCVPFTDLSVAADALKGSNVCLGAQNCHWEKSGAFTGEISAEMLVEANVQYVIIGHSERRQYFGETDITVNKRVKAARAAGLKVILCVGETLEQREAEQTFEVLERQMKGALAEIGEEDLRQMVVAYEPVWAIGTGKTATVLQAQEACAFIRGVLGDLYTKPLAETVQIQYGGSMNAKNAAELLEQMDIDGGLIGGASLKAFDFAEIVKAAAQMAGKYR